MVMTDFETTCLDRHVKCNINKFRKNKYYKLSKNINVIYYIII